MEIHSFLSLLLVLLVLLTSGTRPASALLGLGLTDGLTDWLPDWSAVLLSQGENGFCWAMLRIYAFLSGSGSGSNIWITNWNQPTGTLNICAHCIGLDRWMGWTDDRMPAHPPQRQTEGQTPWPHRQGKKQRKIVFVSFAFIMIRECRKYHISLRRCRAGIPII